jgi:uncharacterized membrane protein
VVGHSDLPEDTGFYGFVWTIGSDTLTPLAPLPGDLASFANNINDGGDIVGASVGEGFSTFTAVLWRNGAIADLNGLAPDSPLSLIFTFSINNSGQIVGLGLTEDGEIHGFLATPNNSASALASVLLPTASRPRVVISERARRLLLRRFGIRKQ